MTVALALIPFVIADSFFNDTLVDGKKPARLIAIALPCLLSYTYPIVLAARVAGWYVQQGRRRGWRLSRTAVTVFGVSILAALAEIWFTDHRFNIKDSAAYVAYWNDCILGLRQNAEAAPRLIAKFLWGWHGRQLLVTAVLVPLQALGVYSVIKRLKRRQPEDCDNIGRSSRPIGSLVLLIGVVLASAIANYPILRRTSCAVHSGSHSASSHRRSIVASNLAEKENGCVDLSLARERPHLISFGARLRAAGLN